METRPPTNFKQYKEWLKTEHGHLWWVRQAAKHHIRFRCRDCGSVIWWTNGHGAPTTLDCGDPCFGKMTITPIVGLGGKEETENERS